MLVHGIQKSWFLFINKFTDNKLALVTDIEGSGVSSMLYFRKIMVVFEEIKAISQTVASGVKSDTGSYNLDERKTSLG